MDVFCIETRHTVYGRLYLYRIWNSGKCLWNWTSEYLENTNKYVTSLQGIQSCWNGCILYWNQTYCLQPIIFMQDLKQREMFVKLDKWVFRKYKQICHIISVYSELLKWMYFVLKPDILFMADYIYTGFETARNVCEIGQVSVCKISINMSHHFSVFRVTETDVFCIETRHTVYGRLYLCGIWNSEKCLWNWTSECL